MSKQVESYDALFEKLDTMQEKMIETQRSIAAQPDDQQRLYTLIRANSQLSDCFITLRDAMIEYINYSTEILDRVKPN